jgi:hypothetical protein
LGVITRAERVSDKAEIPGTRQPGCGPLVIRWAESVAGNNESAAGRRRDGVVQATPTNPRRCRNGFLLPAAPATRNPGGFVT